MKKRKKKKLIIAILIMLVLLMIACGGRGSKDEPAENDTQTIESNESTEEAEQADTEEATEPDADAGDAGDAAESDTGILSPEFKKTMDDYEAWFDHYCEVMKKYQENPSDLELISEMSSLLTEETEMFDQMESMDESEMNNAELAYYIEVTARIEKKLLEVADY